MANMKRKGNPARRPYQYVKPIKPVELSICARLPTEILILIFQPLFDNVCRIEKSMSSYVCDEPRTLDDVIRRAQSQEPGNRSRSFSIFPKPYAFEKVNTMKGFRDFELTITDVARVCGKWRDIVSEMTSNNMYKWSLLSHAEQFKVFKRIEIDAEVLGFEQGAVQEEAKGVENAEIVKETERVARDRREKIHYMRARLWRGF